MSGLPFQIRYQNNLQDTDDVTPAHILNWVMSNTIRNIAKWLPEWAIQGAQYITKRDIPELALIPDLSSLEEMYGCALNEQPVCKVNSFPNPSTCPQKLGRVSGVSAIIST